MAAGAAPVTVTLAAPAKAPAAPSAVPPAAPAPDKPARSIEFNRDAAAAAAVKAAVEPAAPPRAAATSAGTAVTTQPSDPTYYSARDLDVFPKAITALDLSLHAAAPGKLRAMLLIDESGAVNAVRGIEAHAAEIEQAARDVLLRARFTPASKDGRIVKAQVLVSVDYGVPAAPAAP